MSGTDGRLAPGTRDMAQKPTVLRLEPRHNRHPGLPVKLTRLGMAPEQGPGRRTGSEAGGHGGSRGPHDKT